MRESREGSLESRRTGRAAREPEREQEERRAGGARTREDSLPGEAAAMHVPPRNRWQVLLIEYELLDSLAADIQRRLWTSGLVLVGLSMVGLTFMATTLDPGNETLQVIGLVGIVAALLSVGWWVLLRRLFTGQRVAEYRRNEIERELGLRSGLYLTFLRQSRRANARRVSNLARQLSEGDESLESDLTDMALSPAGSPRLPGFLSDRLVWSLVPWLLIASWVGLYVLKM